MKFRQTLRFRNYKISKLTIKRQCGYYMYHIDYKIHTWITTVLKREGGVTKLTDVTFIQGRRFVFLLMQLHPPF